MDVSAFTAAPVVSDAGGEASEGAEASAPETEAQDKGGSVTPPPEPKSDKPEPKEESKAAAKPATPKKDAAPPAPKAKIKLGEDEYDEDVLLKAVKGPLEMVRGAQKRFQELSEAAKKIAEARAEVEQDPFALARKLGKDPIAMAREFLENEIKKAEMSPEARRIADLEERLNSTEKASKAEKDAAAQDAQMKFYQSEIQRLDRELPAAMERASLPKSPVSLRLLTNILADMHEAGVPENLDIAAEIAAEQYTQDLGAHVKALSYEQAMAKYPELVKTIREGDLASARKPPAPSGKSPANAPRAANGKFTAPKTREQIMADEWGPLGVTFNNDH